MQQHKPNFSSGGGFSSLTAPLQREIIILEDKVDKLIIIMERIEKLLQDGIKIKISQ